MAVPIVLNADDPEDSYRSLDFLLEQLLITLRQVLMLRRREAVCSAPPHTFRHRHVSSEGRIVDESSETISNGPENSTRVFPEEISRASSLLPLPDVVLETSSTSEEHKESERTTATTTTTTTTTTTENLESSESSAETHGWVQKEERKGKLKEGKDSSLLSLFCPPLGGSVWTTVALLVGWGLLSRTR